MVENNENWRGRFGFESVQDKLFKAYPCVQKPRIPTEEDKTCDWAQTMRPKQASEFLSHPIAVELLYSLSQPVDPKAPGKNGLSSTGKTSYLQLLLRHLYPNESEHKKYTLLLQGDKLDERELLNKLMTFTRYHERNTTLTDKYLYIAIENFHSFNPRVQQHTIGPIWDTINTKSIYFILTLSPDASRVTEQIKASSIVVNLEPLEPLLVLEKILRICTQERIGYVRAALEMILSKKKYKCIPSLQYLQQLFIKHHYLSVENVRKSMKHSEDICQRKFTIVELSFPLRRCQICTLFPPCNHITLQMMYDKLIRMRSLYPQDNQRTVCPDFSRTGLCHAFHRRGKCLYDHPLEMLQIDTTPLASRCKIHTLLLPCVHCITLEKTQTEVKRLKTQLKQAEEKLKKAGKELNNVQHRLHLHKKTEETLWGNTK
ncbi:hypothetical protein THRCLA_07843, partial [Thraustotheca clavata]